MEKFRLGWWQWAVGVATMWISITAICVIAAWSGYCVSISYKDGFRFAACQLNP